jgi:hypothetical protein
MAASIKLYRATGSGPSFADASGGVRFRNDDANTLDTTNPLVKPASGQTTRSWKASLRLYCVTKGTSTTASNVKFYTASSAWGTGVTLMVQNASLSTTYAQATAAAANDTNYADASTYSSASPLTIDSGSFSLADSTAIAHNWICCFLKVADPATAPQTITAGATIMGRGVIGWASISIAPGR